MTIIEDTYAWRPRGEPDPVDLHVGARLRLRRISLGFSQEVVAQQLGVSFQQLQKYESGTNRVSASRLFDAAHILKVTVAYFFEEFPDKAGREARGPEAPESGGNERSTIDLVRDFRRIASERQRRAIVELVRAIATAVP